MDFDPARLSFERLLERIWESHRPDGRNTSGQYMHAIFYHDDEQKRVAQASKIALEKKLGKPVTTRILPVRSFTMAEDYHQKYILKQNRDLMRELQRIYPQHRDIVASTAASRMNGYAGGNGSADQLAGELPRLGLGPHAEKILLKMVR